MTFLIGIFFLSSTYVFQHFANLFFVMITLWTSSNDLTLSLLLDLYARYFFFNFYTRYGCYWMPIVFVLRSLLSTRNVQRSQLLRRVSRQHFSVVANGSLNAAISINGFIFYLFIHCSSPFSLKDMGTAVWYVFFIFIFLRYSVEFISSDIPVLSWVRKGFVMKCWLWLTCNYPYSRLVNWLIFLKMRIACPNINKHNICYG